jgi:hypothetical protein
MPAMVEASKEKKRVSQPPALMYLCAAPLIIAGPENTPVTANDA